MRRTLVGEPDRSLLMDEAVFGALDTTLPKSILHDVRYRDLGTRAANGFVSWKMGISLKLWTWPTVSSLFSARRVMIKDTSKVDFCAAAWCG